MINHLSLQVNRSYDTLAHMAGIAPMMPNFGGGPVIFFKEVKSELSKVIWPTRNEVVRLTVIVLAVSLIMGIYIGGLDIIFTKLTDLFVKR